VGAVVTDGEVIVAKGHNQIFHSGPGPISGTYMAVRARVYQTVIHEIAHHFGIVDPRLRGLGW
jgi:hypothetical protein